MPLSWHRLRSRKTVRVYPVSYTHLDVYKRQLEAGDVEVLVRQHLERRGQELEHNALFLRVVNLLETCLLYTSRCV